MPYSGTWNQFHPPTIPVRLETIEAPSRCVEVKAALLDTGAKMSVVSSSVAEKLGLFSEHFVPVLTVSGKTSLPLHVVRVVLETETVSLRARGVIEAPMDGFDGLPMIIGRDILQFTTLWMSPTSFTLRVHPPPSHVA